MQSSRFGWNRGWLTQAPCHTPRPYACPRQEGQRWRRQPGGRDALVAHRGARRAIAGVCQSADSVYTQRTGFHPGREREPTAGEVRWMRIRLTGDWVIGHEGGRHCLVEQGEVVYQGARIIFVGHDFPGEVDLTYDYGKALIAPGFVDLDALADLDTTILSFDNQPGWRKGRVWPRTY